MLFNKPLPISVPHLVLCDDPSPQFVVVFEKLCRTNPILVNHNPAQWRQIREDAYIQPFNTAVQVLEV